MGASGRTRAGWGSDSHAAKTGVSICPTRVLKRRSCAPSRPAPLTICGSPLAGWWQVASVCTNTPPARPPMCGTTGMLAACCTSDTAVCRRSMSLGPMRTTGRPGEAARAGGGAMGVLRGPHTWQERGAPLHGQGGWESMRLGGLGGLSWRAGQGRGASAPVSQCLSLQLTTVRRRHGAETWPSRPASRRGRLGAKCNGVVGNLP